MEEEDSSVVFQLKICDSQFAMHLTEAPTTKHKSEHAMISSMTNGHLLPFQDADLS